MDVTQQLLKNTLDQDVVCNQYLALQNDKRDIIIAGDIQKLDALVKEEQSIIMKMESLDHKRVSLLNEMNLGDIVMSDLIKDHVEESLKPQFEDALNKLNETIKSLKKSIFINQRLLNQRLAVVNKVMKALETEQSNTKSAPKGKSKPYLDFIKRA